MEATTSYDEDKQRQEREGELAMLLRCIEQAEATKAYDTRNYYVILAMAEAARLSYGVGVRLDPSEPEWPVIYIELPTGQVSWHLPQHEHEWDGHTTAEKYARCRAYTEPRW